MYKIERIIDMQFLNYPYKMYRHCNLIEHALIEKKSSVKLLINAITNYLKKHLNN